MKEKLQVKLNNINETIKQTAANLNALYGRKFEIEEFLKELELEQQAPKDDENAPKDDKQLINDMNQLNDNN